MSAAETIVYRSSPKPFLALAGLPLLGLAFAIVRDAYASHHIGAFDGAGFAFLALIAASILLMILKPATLTLTTEGFTWRGTFRRPYGARWVDIAKVGLWRRKIMTLSGEQSSGYVFLVFDYRPGHIPPEQTRSAAWSFGMTGWEGGLAMNFGVPPGAILEEFNRRVAAARDPLAD